MRDFKDISYVVNTRPGVLLNNGITGHSYMDMTTNMVAVLSKRAGDQQEILSWLETGRFAQAVRAIIALDARSGADYAGGPGRAIAPDQALAGGLHALEIQKMTGGLPVGTDIAVEIAGPNLDELERIAEGFKALLAQVKGVEDVDDDFLEGKQEIRLRFSDEYRDDPSSVNQIPVRNAPGYLVAVDSTASFERAIGTTVINHIDGKRLIAVTANGDEAVSTVVAAIASIRELARDLPRRCFDR